MWLAFINQPTETVAQSFRLETWLCFICWWTQPCLASSASSFNAFPWSVLGSFILMFTTSYKGSRPFLLGNYSAIIFCVCLVHRQIKRNFSSFDVFTLSVCHSFTLFGAHLRRQQQLRVSALLLLSHIFTLATASQFRAPVTFAKTVASKHSRKDGKMREKADKLGWQTTFLTIITFFSFATVCCLLSRSASCSSGFSRWLRRHWLLLQFLLLELFTWSNLCPAGILDLWHMESLISGCCSSAIYFLFFLSRSIIDLFRFFLLFFLISYLLRLITAFPIRVCVGWKGDSQSVDIFWYFQSFQLTLVFKQLQPFFLRSFNCIFLVFYFSSLWLS